MQTVACPPPAANAPLRLADLEVGDFGLHCQRHYPCFDYPDDRLSRWCPHCRECFVRDLDNGRDAMLNAGHRGFRRNNRITIRSEAIRLGLDLPEVVQARATPPPPTIPPAPPLVASAGDDGESLSEQLLALFFDLPAANDSGLRDLDDDHELDDLAVDFVEEIRAEAARVRRGPTSLRSLAPALDNLAKLADQYGAKSVDQLVDRMRADEQTRLSASEKHGRGFGWEGGGPCP